MILSRRNFVELMVSVVSYTTIGKSKKTLCCPLCKTSSSIEVNSVRAGPGRVLLPTGNVLPVTFDYWSRCMACTRRLGFSDFPGSGLYFGYTDTGKYVIHKSYGGSVCFLFRSQYGNTTLNA